MSQTVPTVGENVGQWEFSYSASGGSTYLLKEPATPFSRYLHKRNKNMLTEKLVFRGSVQLWRKPDIKEYILGEGGGETILKSTMLKKIIITLALE